MRPSVVRVLTLAAIALSLVTLVGCSGAHDTGVALRPGPEAIPQHQPSTASAPRTCQPHASLNPSMGPVGTTLHVVGGCFGEVRRWDGKRPGVFLLHAFLKPPRM